MSDPDAPARDRVPVPWPSDAPDAPAAGLPLPTTELLVLAGAVRGTAWREGLADAIGAARTAGWAEDRIGRRAASMIYDSRAEPRDLAAASALPTRRVPGSPEPSGEYQRIREAREHPGAETPELTAREDPGTR